MSGWLRGWWERFWKGISLLDKDIEEVLSERDSSLKDIYVGAFAVLEDSTNPEFIVQCAHSFRELIEKLPKIADEVYIDVQPSKNRFNNISQDALNNWEIKPYRSIDDLDEQTILKAVETLNRLKEEWGMILTRRDQLDNFVQYEFSDSYKPSDKYLEQVFRKRKDLYGFFVSVCHHQKIVGIEQLSGKIDELNSLLRSLLVKTPTSDTNEIDAILNG